ncbi:hypothetical protein AgCh_014428 [Apium graveolens]
MAASDPFSLENLLCTETDSLYFDDLEAIDDLNHLIDSNNLVDNGSEPLIGLIPMQSDQVVCSLFDKEKDFLPASDYLERLANEELEFVILEEVVDWMYKVADPSFIFEYQSLKSMELNVLASLKWRMHACTPFSYIDFFIRKLKSEDMIPSESLMYGSLIYKSCQFIVNTMKALMSMSILAMEHRPGSAEVSKELCLAILL